MRGNRNTGTRPEMTVRRLLHAMGYRYRLHAKDLPGRPDIVFRKRRLAIQVHGCFWHQHTDSACPLRSKPRSNSGYWDAKLGRNVARDRETQARLTALGWRVETVWECECGDAAGLERRLRGVMSHTAAYGREFSNAGNEIEGTGPSWASAPAGS